MCLIKRLKEPEYGRLPELYYCWGDGHGWKYGFGYIGNGRGFPEDISYSGEGYPPPSSPFKERDYVVGFNALNKCPWK